MGRLLRETESGSHPSAFFTSWCYLMMPNAECGAYFYFDDVYDACDNSCDGDGYPA